MTTIALTSIPATDHAAEGRAWHWACPLVVAMIVGVQLVYFTGVIASDDFAYLAPAAHAIQKGAFTAESLQSFDCHCFSRFVFWKAIQLAVLVYPDWPSAIAMPSFLASIVTLIIIFALGREHFGRPAGLIAMGMCGLVPVCICSASIAVPDFMAAALAWTGMYAAGAALLKQNTPRALGRCLIGGFLIAVGYTAKETVAIMVPGLILFVLFSRTREWWAWKRAIVLGLGSAAWLGLEALILWHWTGDPLYHSHAVVQSQRGYTVASIGAGLAGRLAYATDYLRWLADPRSDLGPVGPVLLAGLVVAAVRRSATSNLLLWVVVVPLAYLSVGSTDWANYRIVEHQPRYLVPLLPGMALLAGSAAWRLWERGGAWRKRAMLAAGVLIVAWSLVIPNRLAGRWYHASTFAAARELLDQWGPPRETGVGVHASVHTGSKLRGLSWCWGRGEVEVLHPAPGTEAEWAARCGGSYVVTGRNDRRPPGIRKHTGLSLWGPPLESLSGFTHVARATPPRDRLSTLWSRLTGRPAPTDPEWAVDLWHVP